MSRTTADARLDALHAAARDALKSGTPAALHAAIESALGELVGFRLLTILRLADLQLERVYSSRAEAYPAGGTKSIRDDIWLREMLTAGRPTITSGEPALSQRFVDHEAIRSLGCGSVFNVPIIAGQRTCGSLNLLHRAGWFRAEHIELAVPFARLLGCAWQGFH